jgi:hypothetical protein
MAGHRPQGGAQEEAQREAQKKPARSIHQKPREEAAAPQEEDRAR